MARPPLASGRLEKLDDDLLSFRLKTPWSDGTTHLVLSPMELIEKLAALVPPPRVNLVRYHGVLAPNAKDRARIVPAGKDARPDACEGFEARSTHRVAWAALLARVFHLQMTRCEHCGGRMRIVAAITEPASVRRYLAGVGLPADPLALAPARPPPQAEFDYDC